MIDAYGQSNCKAVTVDNVHILMWNGNGWLTCGECALLNRRSAIFEVNGVMKGNATFVFKNGTLYGQYKRTATDGIQDFDGIRNYWVPEDIETREINDQIQRGDEVWF